MEVIKQLIDFILHIDRHLFDIVSEYHGWTYLILFAIVFLETGVVVTPFLPGDSLLFAAGAIAANPATGLNVFAVILLLIISAIAGDTLNYAIGKFIGPKVFLKDYKLLKRSHLEKTQAFYDKHGGKTIIIARFIPIIRTFAPFVAGVGSMNYKRFISYNIVGGIAWVVIFTLLGYFFGNLPVVKKNFTLVIFAIIFLSITPPFIEYFRHKFRSNSK